ncbi:MAG: Tyrosine recombinase XerD [Candidatus Gottesmanbacteria bacterium GW2011_GWA1_43_11]|uniref:Tyrosine recombinase XerD n=1 Tax=Candidatus Gottesmanbacteria bacterium GW2011_GWA1_43_11 TaxID=1618436 RepID=A0A0G1CJ82_9BACT|nr:MAG: Tyrosine recombinase XerD [Candidatus Gottesmanbacteria bacterium GW2011_GWA1_43_11]
MSQNTEISSAQSEFITHLRSRKRASATIVAYGKDIDQLVSFLKDMGKKTMAEISKDDLLAFLGKLGKDGYTPKSISRKINSIKTFYRFLKAQSYVVEDPTVNISHPKYEVKPPRILSRVEYRALRDACRDDARISAIVELFLQTGLRIGELANLKLTDVRDNELQIAAQESHAQRVVPLNKAAKQAVDRYLETRSKTENPTLFVTKTGRPLLIRNIRTAIDRYFKLAGIEKAKVNDLRHTFIAHHLASGTPLTVISKLVGHKRLSTTEKYLEFIKGKAEENVKLEEL